MLGELELANLLDGNRRSDMPGRGNRLPATHARGHSSPNQDGSGSSSDNLAYLTSRYVCIYQYELDIRLKKNIIS